MEVSPTLGWRVVANHVPGPSELAVLVVAVIVIVVEAALAYRRARRESARWVAPTLLALRIAVALALVAVALEVGVRIETRVPVTRRVVVLVDRSASMALADGSDAEAPPRPRHERIREVWADAQTARASWRDQGLLVDVRAFGHENVPISGSLDQTLATPPTDPASNLAGALGQLRADDAQASPLTAVVVLSDGLVAPSDADREHLLDLVDVLAIPVTTVAAGTPHIRDASVVDVRAGDFAFVENVAEFDATIVAHGLAGAQTTVELRRDGQTVATQPLTLESDGAASRVRFEVAPDRTGNFVYEIAIAPLEGEATTANNGRTFVVRVLRDKVRVLHVAGRPDWDVRSLRTLLRRDPNVELLSYYILRDREDPEPANSSLVRFPTEELFEEELGSFDLVIMHNFDAVQHEVGRYLGNIASYVLDGGTLVLIGGNLGLSDGDYGVGPLAELLPVDAGGRPGSVRDPFRPQLTEAGARHPITAWLGRVGDNGWAGLPELEDFNPVAEPVNGSRLGAVSLLVHPTERDASGRPRPILAVAEPGKGRSVVLATGSSWRLGFAEDLPLIDGMRPYDLLWLGAVRWLLRDESAQRLTLATERPNYDLGDPIRLQATTRGPSYAPEPGVTVGWRVVALGREDRPAASGTWVTDGLGRVEHELDPLPIGAYAAVAARPLDDDASGLDQQEARRVFLVDPPARELARTHAAPGTELLRALAEASRGRALVASTGDRLPADLPLAPAVSRGRTLSARDVPLWNGWIALVGLIAVFCGEWFLRRRHGER